MITKHMYSEYFDAASNLVAISLSMKLLMVSEGVSPNKADEMISLIGDDVREAYQKSEPFIDAEKVFSGKMSLEDYTIKVMKNLGGRK